MGNIYMSWTTLVSELNAINFLTAEESVRTGLGMEKKGRTDYLDGNSRYDNIGKKKYLRELLDMTGEAKEIAKLG